MKIKNQKGFTLIEILLVIVIIGILAGAVFAMIGNSDNAKLKATLSTAKSILTYAQECQFKGESLVAPSSADGSDSGDLICANTISEWPELSVSDCAYAITDAVNGVYEVNCTGVAKHIVCDAKNGSCQEVL